MDDENAYGAKIRKATLLLLLEARTPENEEECRSEILLDRAGFASNEIAELLGKQPGAVRMTLSRARKQATGNG